MSTLRNPSQEGAPTSEDMGAADEQAETIRALKIALAILKESEIGVAAGSRIDEALLHHGLEKEGLLREGDYPHEIHELAIVGLHRAIASYELQPVTTESAEAEIIPIRPEASAA
jgi:hypothetical protein